MPNRYAISIQLAIVDDNGDITDATDTYLSSHASSDHEVMIRYFTKLIENMDEYLTTTSFILGPQAGFTLTTPFFEEERE